MAPRQPQETASGLFTRPPVLGLVDHRHDHRRPKRAQDGPREAPVHPKMVSKMAPRSSKSAEEGLGHGRGPRASTASGLACSTRSSAARRVVCGCEGVRCASTSWLLVESVVLTLPAHRAKVETPTSSSLALQFGDKKTANDSRPWCMNFPSRLAPL